VNLLNLLPWCRLDREYTIGEIILRPYSIGNELPGIDESARRHVELIVSAYRDIEGKAFGHPSIAVWRSHQSPLHALSAEEEETLTEMVTVACFASLAYRDLASAGGKYSNSTRFNLHRNRFERVGDLTSLVYRRRDGRVGDGRQLSDLTFTSPVQVATHSDIAIDEPLAQGIIRFRDQSAEADWNRLLNALTWFNFGNSDSETVSVHMEFVAHASAIQELLGSDGDERAFAGAVAPALSPAIDLLAARSTRNEGFWSESTKPLRFEWARELYRVRNQFAHGRLVARRQHGWSADEHLTLAAIAFPLLVKQHLEQRGCYSLDSLERGAIRGFERLLDTRFLERPDPALEDQWYPWSRIVADESLKIALERTSAEMIIDEASPHRTTGEQQ
jgi:hypothetical protein